MTTTEDGSRVSVFASVLGDELRRTRMQRGWSRKDLQSRLETHISIQTVATYEAGSRQCSVVRLVELCRAMGVPAHELLARVHERAEVDVPGRLMLDLHHVVRDHQAELVPLRLWAQEWLNQADCHQTPAVPLDFAALESLAQLCGMEPVDLIQRLRPFVHTAR